MLLAIHPTQLPEQEESLASALRRPADVGRGWGLVRTILLSGISFGVLPLLAWPIRMRDLFAGEAARLLEVGAFVEARDPGLAHRLGLFRAARRTGPRPMLWVGPILLAVGIILTFAQQIAIGVVRKPDDLLQLTYQSGQSASLNDPVHLLQTVFGIWSAALIVGYLLHWLHLQVHLTTLRRFVTRFNAVLEIRGLPAIGLPRRSLMPNVFWLAAGAVMAGCFGAWWAVPMVIVGSLQRRDAFAVHRDLGKALADRVEMLAIVHPRPGLRCSTPRCRALLKPDTRFCPRCGAAVSPVYAPGGIWA